MLDVPVYRADLRAVPILKRPGSRRGYPGLPDGLPNTGVAAPEAVRLVGEDWIATRNAGPEFPGATKTPVM